jgi:hypothetical protein
MGAAPVVTRARHSERRGASKALMRVGMSGRARVGGLLGGGGEVVDDAQPVLDVLRGEDGKECGGGCAEGLGSEAGNRGETRRERT